MPRSRPGDACAFLPPGQLIPGDEHYTGRSWPALMHASPATGHFIHVAFRLVGALNVAVGLPLGVIALTAFASGHGGGGPGGHC